MHKLRYLNVRSNFFREFPQVLCGLQALEILDISRNKIRTLPRNIGHLMNLKVLSISKNRIEVLPSYIGHMSELRILKIDHNPVVFPPAEITSYEGGEDDMDIWLMNIKSFLRTHGQTHAAQASFDDSDVPTSDDEGAETDFNTISKSGPSEHGSASLTPYSSLSSTSHSTVVKLSKKAPPPPIPTKNSHRNAAVHVGNSKSVSGMRSFVLNPLQSPDMERSRSNSESDDRRPFMRPIAMSRTRTGLGPVLEDRSRHSRGFSHDYIQESAGESGSNLRSPAEVQHNSRAYFRRLSSLPQSKRISLSSANVVEASRGMLFALSQIHMAVRQYVIFCAVPELTGAINRVLYNANAHVGALVDVLEAHETRPEGADTKPVIEACRACVGAFKHVINIFHTRMRDLTSQADVRYTRTLLMLLFGAAAEMQNSWTTLAPSASASQPTSMASSQENITRSVAQPGSRLKSHSNASAASFAAMQKTPTTAMASDSFVLASAPVGGAPAETMSMMETDEQLFEKISLATAATLTLLSLLGETASNSAIASAQGPATPGAVANSTNNKLRELMSNCMGAGEVTRRLKNTLPNARVATDLAEKNKLWEDTNSFVKAVINVAALARSISSEYPFSKAIVNALSAVARTTKDLTILLAVSSFSPTVRANEVVYNPATSNTPLSASLGPAQAVLTPALPNFPSGPLSSPYGNVNRFDAEFNPSLNGIVASEYT